MGSRQELLFSDPDEVEGPKDVPSRKRQIERLLLASSESNNNNEEYDVLIIGGGATGSGAALDAASRGYKTACIERGDFGGETSSRSTKLIWAGIKYMATASAALLSVKLLQNPVATVRDFWTEMKMVYSCHRERRYMMEKNRHLCHWIPIAVPFDKWYISPPPFGHPLFSFFPILAPAVLKFYDALSHFTCPPSYILTPSRVAKVFPQLDSTNLKYCAVFYEAQHNDARTNLAISMSAAKEGAHIVNHVEMIDTIPDPDTGKVNAIVALDRMTGRQFIIRAKKIIFCGGPFTDSLRQLEHNNCSSHDQQLQPAVRGAHGTHIVLPGYYCPSNIGLLDYQTSDGRFLFFLPWQGHTLVGTTDRRGPAQTLPTPPQDEINWLLNEASKYMRCHFQRSDVLSAWRGWRPLAVDPHAKPDAPVSRDHVISENPDTGIIFIAGGKWTTWREMAEQVVDRALGTSRPCKTLDITLFGGKDYSDNLAVELIQRYRLPQDVAEHLAQTYGGRAREVLNSCDTNMHSRLAPDYPYILAEVVYACREYACTIEDVLSRRTRLAFLNKAQAMNCIPKVGAIMANELGWSDKVCQQQQEAAAVYIGSYGGPSPPIDDKVTMTNQTEQTVPAFLQESVHLEEERVA